MKDKNSAGLLALFLGGLGVHKFYTGRTGTGIVYLVFCWTLIPVVVSLVEAIMFFTMSQDAFNRKYNAEMPALAPQNIVVNVQNTAVGGGASVHEQLKALHDLKVAGALSEEEFAVEKRKLLSGG